MYTGRSGEELMGGGGEVLKVFYDTLKEHGLGTRVMESLAKSDRQINFQGIWCVCVRGGNLTGQW